MASTINLEGEGSDLVLFSYAGKKMIGKLYNTNPNVDGSIKSSSIYDTNSVINTMLVN